MYKIKIFQGEEIGELEEEINDWLKRKSKVTMLPKAGESYFSIMNVVQSQSYVSYEIEEKGYTRREIHITISISYTDKE